MNFIAQFYNTREACLTFEVQLLTSHFKFGYIHTTFVSVKRRKCKILVLLL